MFPIKCFYVYFVRKKQENEGVFPCFLKRLQTFLHLKKFPFARLETQQVINNDTWMVYRLLSLRCLAESIRGGAEAKRERQPCGKRRKRECQSSNIYMQPNCARHCTACTEQYIMAEAEAQAEKQKVRNLQIRAPSPSFCCYYRFVLL